MPATGIPLPEEAGGSVLVDASVATGAWVLALPCVAAGANVGVASALEQAVRMTIKSNMQLFLRAVFQFMLNNLLSPFSKR